MSIVNWFVDASHMTHMDCKGHVGGAMTLGKGAVISVSSRIKSNTKISTETEIYGADHLLNTVLWRNYFLEEQGYTTENNIMYQDNQSCMRLKINRALYSSGRTKHIKARYHYITNKIEDGDIEVNYCPTDEMWVDMLTKPKQGTPFKKNRALLQNVPIDYDEKVEHKITHPELLPRHDTHKKENMVKQQAKPFVHHGSVLGMIPNTSNGTPSGLGLSKQFHENPGKVSIKGTTYSYAEDLQGLY